MIRKLAGYVGRYKQAMFLVPIFVLFDVLGGSLWVIGIITVGYFFGNIAWVKLHLDKIIWAMILIPGLVIIAGAWRARHKARSA